MALRTISCYSEEATTCSVTAQFFHSDSVFEMNKSLKLRVTHDMQIINQSCIVQPPSHPSKHFLNRFQPRSVPPIATMEKLYQLRHCPVLLAAMF